MYCKNCGTKNNDQAKYCIKCGEQLGDAIVVGKNPHQAKKKPWNLFAVLISLALVITVTTATTFDLWPWSTKTGAETSDIRTRQVDGDKIVQYKDDTSDTAGVATQEQTEPETKPVPEAETYAKPAATWHDSTKPHDININHTISFRDGIIWNFGQCTAVGAGLDSDVITETEADYGFVLSVMDEDSVLITPYANREPYVAPVHISAELASGDISCGIPEDEQYESYRINGYEACGNGLGLITVTFSNGKELTAGVFKEDGMLYAVNITDDVRSAERTVGQRLLLDGLMDGNGITMEDALFTDPIYYPIVPANDREHTDTQYWLDKSFEITESEWTDAHKAVAIYNYIIENLAYDHWVVNEGAKSRTFLYKDYTGTYFTSRTRAGVCEDFSQIFAIMCRGQGIPAFAVENNSHAMSVCYIKDYGRWLTVDTTPDLFHALYKEDPLETVESNAVRYAHLNRMSSTSFDTVTIGNIKDMELYGIPTLMDR